MPTALITGANKGIGYEVARQLGQQGFRIWLSGRNPERVQTAVDQLHQEGIPVAGLVMDTGDLASIAQAVSQVKSHLPHLDVLINNAALLLDEGRSLLSLSPTELQQGLQINSLGPVWVTQAFLPILKPGSRVINVSSGAGEWRDPPSTWAPLYSTSKTALNLLTRHLARELSPQGIAINAVCPGWVKTDMGGSGANRSVEKGAETIVWLATEAAPELSGRFFRDKAEIRW
jgi:NAD(P)-dependent dehydrogenase (short-subunit alcohol dehydrogenase family)